MSVDKLIIPEFHRHTRRSRGIDCMPIDYKNIIAEILGGEFVALEEIKGSDKAERVLIDGKYCIVLRYKREKNNLCYPTVVLGYDILDDGGVLIQHIQGIKGPVSYRFSSGFDSFSYFLEFLKKNFSDKGIVVKLSEIPKNLEGSSYASKAPELYVSLRRAIHQLNSSKKDNSGTKKEQ